MTSKHAASSCLVQAAWALNVHADLRQRYRADTRLLMTKRDQEETLELWDAVASDWKLQVGDEGDTNRRLNSDPVLWRFAGDVRGRAVLDAGCGTGYLSNKLTEAGAHVIGVDFSARMIELARRAYPAVEFRVDSCAELSTVPDASVDLVVSNYVLMDTPYLDETVAAFARVLRPGGTAVLVFSHPCFPGGRADSPEGNNDVTRYTWPFPYFQSTKCTDPPWAHFTTDFIWFHRPLSEYWRAFTRAGFHVVDFDEPHLTGERHHLASSAAHLRRSLSRPFSVAFKLGKMAHEHG